MREIPTRKEFHLGDEEREDLSEVATVATLEIAPRHTNEGKIATSGSAKRFAISMTRRLCGVSVTVLGPNCARRLAASAAVRPEALLSTRS